MRQLCARSGVCGTRPVRGAGKAPGVAWRGEGGASPKELLSQNATPIPIGRRPHERADRCSGERRAVPKGFFRALTRCLRECDETKGRVNEKCTSRRAGGGRVL